ncbi:MAG: hypothetical protein PHY12_12445 [Eubacteriales bacterium]|nr:hypothetical protein [Eubacteriales bacterium]
MLAAEQVCWIPMGAIDGWQDGEADEPGESGEAVRLRPEENGRYTLLRGAARLRELAKTGQSCVDAVLCPRRDVNARVSALLSRLLAGELDPFEEAEAYQQLLDEGEMTRQELAARLGRSLATLQKKLRLLQLDEDCRELLRGRRLCERYAAAVLRIPSRTHRVRTLRHILENDLSVKDAETLIEETLARLPIPVPKERRLMPAMRDSRLYVNAIRGIVEQMRDAGLAAEFRQTAGTTLTEITVTVPRFGKP